MQLVERDGRRLRLTAHALELLERARPLVADLRALAEPVAGKTRAHFSLALAHAIAASWGPAVIGRARQPQLLERPFLPLETFSATVQMVKAGFGDGLVPLGMAREMHLDPRCYREVAGVRRRISLVTRKTVNQLVSFQRLREQIALEAQRHFAAASHRGRRK